MKAGETAITIAGAGSIGCHAGGCLALAGRRVTLLARPGIAEAVGSYGMTIIDLDGTVRPVVAGALTATTDPAVALAGADLVLVTVKCGATAEMAALVAAHARPGAVVMSLQNGVDNVGVLKSVLGGRFTVLAGMLPFNVVQSQEPGRQPAFRRTTSGSTMVESGAQGLAALLNVPGFPVGDHADMQAVLWGKLLLNLNNALNALSGLPLAEQLADRRWRQLLADQIAEALAVMRTAGVRAARIGALRPPLLPHVLRLPDWLFARLARRMLAVDPNARSSMWEDLERGRTTEIDYFQAAIVRLAAAHGLRAPISEKIVGLVHIAESQGRGSPGLKPSEVSALA